MEKQLGKIQHVSFGLGGYQDACIGLNVTIGGDGWGCSTDKTAWDANIIQHTEYHKWSETDRDAQYAAIVRFVSDLLAAAKVRDVSALKGIPVEATFDGNMLKDWRVLTEVL